MEREIQTELPAVRASKLIKEARYYTNSSDSATIRERALYVANNFLSCYKKDRSTAGVEKFKFWSDVIEQIDITDIN